ncbi:MAG: cyclic diguanylate phosphodiesterase [Gammaproteobacteria bacterium]|nr:cyclic diguanylate phosphodiesterase [Gammaproteobacteria bacterium]
MSTIKIALLIFAVTFSIGLATVSYFNHFYAEKALYSDAELLLYQFHDAILDAKEVLKSLPQTGKIDCNSIGIERLSQLSYRHPAVRLIGVLRNDGHSCTSAPVNFDLSKHHKQIRSQNSHKLSASLLLANIGRDQEPLDLLVISIQADGYYFASINPFMVNYLVEFTCTDCLEYTFIVDGFPKLEFHSREMSQPSFVNYRASRREGAVNMDLYLRGSKQFYNGYKQLSWATTIIFSAIIAAAIALLSYKLLTLRQSMERIIKDAIKFDEFVPFYQPIVDSRNDKIVGAEVLVRWQRRDGALVPPYQFVPFAEANLLIIAITEQLVKKTIADIARFGWNKSGQFMSINIVPEHLKTDHFYEFVSSQLDQLGVPATSISLEITERMQIDNLELARNHLEKFYQAGIELKLDDAGTGYGGFSYIQELGISTLKIDKMFIDTIGLEDIKSPVLESIISFAKSSGLKLIAEGVESENQKQYLKEHGVYMIQGYVYAKPMSAEAFIPWMASRTLMLKPHELGEIVLP